MSLAQYLPRLGMSCWKKWRRRNPPRKSCLSTELKRVGEVFKEMESEGIELPSAIAAARLLILTGCRLASIGPRKMPPDVWF